MDAKNEYNWYIFSGSKSFGLSPNFVPNLGGEHTGFASLYGVDARTAKAIKEEGTTSQFKGVVWGERLWIDIDNKPASEAKERAIVEAIEKIGAMGYDFDVYDSGSGGAHVGILRSTEPSHRLPAKDKFWATTHFPACDPTIYTHLHLFRLPGTVHEVSGEPKRLIASKRGKRLTYPSDMLKGLKDAKIGDTGSFDGPSSGLVSVFDHHRVLANTVPTHNGARHATMVRLAYALKDDAGQPFDVALWYVNEVNKMAEESKPLEEVEKLVRSVYR